MFLGTLADDNDYDIDGDIYSIGDNRLVIEGITNNIEAPDIYFILGTHGGKPNKDGILLPFPLQGIGNKTPFQNETSDGEQNPILLTLPSSVKVPDLKWMSIWIKSLDKIMGQVAFTNQAKSTDEQESNFSNNETHGEDENGQESESLYDKGENSLSDHDNLIKEKTDKTSEENSSSEHVSVDTDTSFNGDGDTNQKVDKHNQDHPSKHQDDVQNDHNQDKSNIDQETPSNATSPETNSNLNTISDGQNNIQGQYISENDHKGSNQKDQVSQPSTESEVNDDLLIENNGNSARESEDSRSMNNIGKGQEGKEASNTNKPFDLETSTPHSNIYQTTTEAHRLEHENDESSDNTIKNSHSEINGSAATTEKSGFVNDIETSTKDKNIKDSNQEDSIIATQTEKHNGDTNTNINKDDSQESRLKDQELDSNGGSVTSGTVHDIEASTKATKHKTIEDSNQGNRTITSQTGMYDTKANITKDDSQGTRPKEKELDSNNKTETSDSTLNEPNSISNSSDGKDLAGSNETKSDQNPFHWLDGQKLESTDIHETNGAINLGEVNENVDRIQDDTATNDNLDGQFQTNTNDQETKDDSSQTNISESSNGEKEPDSGTHVLINSQQVGASVTNQNDQTNNTSSLLDQKASNDQDSADTPYDTETKSIVDQEIPGQDEHTLSDTISDIDSDFEELIDFDPNYTMNEKNKTNMAEDSKETNNEKTQVTSNSAAKKNASQIEDGSHEASLNNTELNGQNNSESKNHSDASSSNSNSKNENDDLNASNGNQNMSEADKFDDNENSIDSEKDQNTNKNQENQTLSDHVTNSDYDKTHLPSNTNSNPNSISNLEDKTLSSTTNTNQTQEEKGTSLGTHKDTSETFSKLPDFKETIPDSQIKPIQDDSLVGQGGNGIDNNSDQDKENEINVVLDTNGEQSMAKDYPENSNVIKTGIETSTVITNQNTTNDKSNDGSDWFDNWISDEGSIYKSTGNPIKILENGHVNAGNRWSHAQSWPDNSKISCN